LIFSKQDFSSDGTDAALRAAAGGARRGDPRHFASHRLALGVVRQRHQHVDVIAQFVFAGRGDENATFLKQGM
jgi:hypothetical protein